MNIEERVEVLESLVDRQKEEIDILKEEINIIKTKVTKQEEIDDKGWKRNSSGDYMIKILYPDIFLNANRNNPSAGFPRTRKKLSQEIQVGQLMFIYVTNPIKKIIGMGRVTSIMQDNVGSKWPFTIPFEWVIKPKSGISFKEAGVDIRVRVGDTLFSLDKNKADIILDKLKSQPDLDDSIMDYISMEFKKTVI
ncbi:hypothetical protein [Clostridium estertheticum]|uniref:EVE domain-containing protein n=1 Tax=Clostridium estertheticum TaxID=238834 RepID=A0A7Y3T0F0_9CLOT|nr:hypothetical protein [Clostridium estertheticum]NNU78755.1 hypothetical protein [Clostridium estertheticum]WBL49697.1 hypothetical protein LOR37_23535 [Clostridium estertheticum]